MAGRVTGGVYDNNIINYDQDDGGYSQSLCRCYRLSRPMPEGKRVYITLLQFTLQKIMQGITELYFQVFLLTHVHFIKESGAAVVPISILFTSFSHLMCLPMGFIADRYFGRAKVLYYSWILLFISQLMISLYFIIDTLGYIHHESLIYISLVGVLIYSIGLAGVEVNLIPFGVDQMKTASSDQLSSYFYWLYWCINAGYCVAYSIVGSMLSSTSDVLVLLASCTAAAAGAIINILGYNWFVKVQNVSNPLLLVYRVLKYAATAKRPVSRTAFSYDGRPEPSRIDLAKVTHLGRFRDEQVEDVKTFLRIVVFLISLIGFLCVQTSVSI